MLQNVGIAARETFGENFWVQQAMKKMLDEPELNLKYVITDVRFENEADMIRANGGQIWRVKRPGFGPVNAHISESEMEGYKADQIFYNGGSISDLEVLVTTRMRAYVG
jgi:hypothetical protein